MAHSSHARSNVWIDLFNLPSLPDERTMTMNNNLTHGFELLDGKNFKISQIINKWIFGRQTPDGNEGVGVKILYLEHAYGSRYYVVDQINGNISAIHENSIKPTDFFGHFSPFNLKELEFDVGRIADHHNGEEDSRLDDERRQMTQSAPAPPQSAQPRSLQPFHELQDMVHNGKVFSMEQCTNLYFLCIEVINYLVESFQMYSTHIITQNQQLNTDPNKQNKHHTMRK